MVHVSNILDPEYPSAKDFLEIYYHEEIAPGGRDAAWARHLAWIEKHIVGPPAECEYGTVEELEAMHYVGIYSKD
jgi:hypothetical protein